MKQDELDESASEEESHDWKNLRQMKYSFTKVEKYDLITKQSSFLHEDVSNESVFLTPYQHQLLTN